MSCRAGQAHNRLTEVGEGTKSKSILICTAPILCLLGKIVRADHPCSALAQEGADRAVRRAV